jgi:hypothetical protein
MNHRSGKLVLPALVLAACGSATGPAADGGTEAGVRTGDVAACSASWRVIFARQPPDSPTIVRWNGQKLYFAGGLGLNSMPDAGGTPTLMADATAEALWIEGHTLLFATFGGTLFSMPLAGGTSVMLLDGESAGADGAPAFFRAHALDGSHYYWNRGRQSDHGVWRLARAGGNAQKLLSLAQELEVETFTSTPDTLIVSLPKKSVAVPKSGTPPRPLSQTGPFVGADSGGVLWVQEASEKRRLMRSSLSGADPVPFWPTMPANLAPARAWPDGGGGWVMAATEAFPDGEHLSLWRVDRNQQGARLACDAVTGGSLPRGDVEAAITPDAVYLPVSYSLALGSEWSMVRVSR